MPASHGSKLASRLASSIWGGFSGPNRNRNPKRSRAVSQSGLQWNDWLVVWNMAFVTFHILGMSSSQLLLTHIFQRGWNHQPGDLICWNYLNPSTAKSFCLEVVSINFQTNSDYRRCDLQVLPGHFLLGGFARNWATPNPWISSVSEVLTAGVIIPFSETNPFWWERDIYIHIRVQPFKSKFDQNEYELFEPWIFGTSSVCIS